MQHNFIASVSFIAYALSKFLGRSCTTIQTQPIKGGSAKSGICDEMTETGPKIIYDGDCPFCASYVGLLRLRDTFGEVALMNARECPELVVELASHNMDLDEGMVLVLNGEYFHGSECVHRLALLASGSNTFNTINKWIFERKKAAAVLYPILRAGRNLSLRILGIKKIQVQPAPPVETAGHRGL